MAMINTDALITIVARLAATDEDELAAVQTLRDQNAMMAAQLAALPKRADPVSQAIIDSAAAQLTATATAVEAAINALPPPPIQGAVAPGLALGIYGDDGPGGSTRIGPSDGTLPSGAFTNKIFVSDLLGSDLFDGSAPTHTTGIHGPVKTLIKAVGGTGPGAYDPDHNSPHNGDGTGLGTIGAGNGFGARSGFPDWILLRKGDTFSGQTFERAFDASNGSDNFQLSGYSEQEPFVISSYDENFPTTTPNVGTRARPIVLVPSSTSAYATSKGAGNHHLYEGRSGISLQGGGSFVAVMGIDFYAAQRNPSDPAYAGIGNIVDNLGVDHRGYQTGALIEDVRTRWFASGITFEIANLSVNIRRCQVDHCYSAGSGHTLGIAVDDVKTVGGVGGAMSPGFNFEENVIDLCGWNDPAFTMGDTRSRNVYIQWDAIFGNRRGNISTRSASECFQFRSGGIIDNNFTWGGSYGIDVGHPEGMPTLDSRTRVTNNVVTATAAPFGAGFGVGINFCNASGAMASGNVIAHMDRAFSAFAWYAQTDASAGTTHLLTISSPGTGGVAGWYGGIGYNYPASFTGGHGTTPSIYSFHIGPSGGVDDYAFHEPVNGATYLVGDVLLSVSGSPSINTAGTTLIVAGTGGTPGDYGTAFPSNFIGYPGQPGNPTIQSVTGIPLTNFSGSMAGSGAVATFTIGPSGNVTAYEIVGTGRNLVPGDVLTATFGGISGVRIRVDKVANISGWGVTVASIETSGTHGLNFTGNVIYDWPDGGPPASGDAGGVHDSPGGVPGSGAANIWTPNQVNLPAATYLDPTRTVESYAASLGLPASIDGFMDAALANSKWNYDPRLTSRKLNDYIRAGFASAI